jgi:hypothetical protein
MHSSSSYLCYMPHSSHQLDHSDYTGRRVQVMKPFIMQFPPPPSLHSSSVQIFSSAIFKAHVTHSILLPPGFLVPSKWHILMQS